MALKGSCACKAITYCIKETPKLFHVCHCTICQAWSGGVAFSIEGGKDPKIEDPSNYLAVWKSSDWAERGFCSNCGSSLFSRLTIPGDAEGNHYFCPGGVEIWDDSWKMGNELYVDRKPSVYCFKESGGPDHKALTKSETETMLFGAPSESK